MTEPGYVPPPQPGWWVRKDRVGTSQTITDYETSVSGYKPTHYWQRKNQLPNGKVGPMALRNKFRMRPTRNPAKVLPETLPVFSSIGAGAQGLNTTLSYTHTLDATAKAVILYVSYHNGTNSSAVIPSPMVTFGGVAMSQLGGIYAFYDGTNFMWLLAYGLLNPPQGVNTVTLTGVNSYTTMNSVAYRNVSGWGPVTALPVGSWLGNPVSANPSITAGSPNSNRLVSGAIAGYTQSFSAVTPRERYIKNYTGSQGLSLAIGDADGPAGTIGCTAVSQSWAALTVELECTIPTYTTPTWVGTGLGTTGPNGKQTPSWTWYETVPAEANCAVLWLSELPTAIPKTCTVTLGGTSMVEMTGSPWTFDASSNWNRMRGFYLLNPPTGPRAVAITTSTNNYIHAETVYYSGVTSVAPMQPEWGPASTSPTITLANSATNHLYALGMSHRSVDGNSTFSALSDNRSSSATVATARNLAVDTWGDLVDTTDAVTVTVNSSGSAVVSIYAEVAYTGGAYGTPAVTVELSGANTMAANDSYRIVEGPGGYLVGSFTLTGLTPGSTTFKLKYRRYGGGTGAWNISNRKITVGPPLGGVSLRAVRQNYIGSTNPLAAGDAYGNGGSLTVNATRIGSSYPWQSTAVDLSPVALPTYSTPTWAGTGVAYPHFTGNASYTETVPANANCAVLFLGVLGNTAVTVTLDGAAMTAITPVGINTGAYTLQAFYKLNPSTGPNKTLSITNTNGNNVQASMIYYGGVTSVSSAASLANQAAAAAAISVSSTVNHMYVNGLAFQPNAADNRFITYDKTVRWIGRNDNLDLPILTGDAAGTGSTLTFNATRNNTTSQWGGLILDLA